MFNFRSKTQNDDYNCFFDVKICFENFNFLLLSRGKIFHVKFCNWTKTCQIPPWCSGLRNFRSMGNSLTPSVTWYKDVLLCARIIEALIDHFLVVGSWTQTWSLWANFVVHVWICLFVFCLSSVHTPSEPNVILIVRSNQCRWFSVGIGSCYCIA